MSNRRIAFLIMIGIAVALVPAQGADVSPVLSQGDITLFVSTFPVIEQELKQMDFELETDGAGVSVLPQAMAASAEVRQLFVSHGWDQDFFVKLQTMVQGLAFVIAEADMTEASPELEAAIAELDATPVNEYFTQEMKDQMRRQLLQAGRQMDAHFLELGARFASSDLALIRQNRPAMEVVLQIE